MAFRSKVCNTLQMRAKRGFLCTTVAALVCGSLIMLAGVAALQNKCPKLDFIGRGSVSELTRQLQKAETILRSLSRDRPLEAVSGLGKALPAMMRAMSILAGTATSSVFTQTPDQSCSAYFRYQWLTTSLQISTMVALLSCLAAGVAHQARVALCSLLVLCSVLCIECAHTFYYFGSLVEGNLRSIGATFLTGCIISVICNLLVCLYLGSKEKKEKGKQFVSSTCPAQDEGQGVRLTASQA